MYPTLEHDVRLQIRDAFKEAHAAIIAENKRREKSPFEGMTYEQAAEIIDKRLVEWVRKAIPR